MTDKIEPITLAEMKNIPPLEMYSISFWDRIHAALADREKMIAEKTDVGTLDDCIKDIRKIREKSIIEYKPVDVQLREMRRIIENIQCQLAPAVDTKAR